MTTLGNENSQGGGSVWRRGGIDSWSGKANAFILNEDGSAEDGANDCLSMCNGVWVNACLGQHSVFARMICVPNSLLGVLVRHLVL
jgi:hypothetical protein